MLPQLSMSCLKLECVLPKFSGIMKQVKLLASCQHYTACRVDKQCAKCTIGSSVQAGEQGVYIQRVCKCVQVVHFKCDKLRYCLGILNSFPKQFPSSTQAVSKLVHHLDIYVSKGVSKLHTACLLCKVVVLYISNNLTGYWVGNTHPPLYSLGLT